MSDDPSVAPIAGAHVCAVVVTYHPDASLAERLKRVARQVGATLIVDNGSSEDELRRCREPLADTVMTWVCNGENLGIARALNIGAAWAKAKGYRSALLLDQDTLVDAEMVSQLVAVQASVADGERIAVVGSRFRDPKGQHLQSIRLPTRGEDWHEVESVITSGSLLSLRAYAAIGPFRDDFFIDYVDTEYCFRARRAGYKIIESRTPLMSHSVGAPSAHSLFGATTWTSNHSAERRYYIARNNTVLLREYGTSGRGPWQWKSLIRCLRLCKRIAYYESDKLPKIVAVAQGWRDGMRGKMGPRARRSI